MKSARVKHDAVIQEMAAHKHQHAQEIEELNKIIEDLKQKITSLESSDGQELVKKYEVEIAQFKEEATRHAKELNDLKSSYEQSLQNKVDASVIDELKANHAKEIEELQNDKNQLEAEIAVIHSNHHQSMTELRGSHIKEIQEKIDNIEKESKEKEESLQSKLSEVVNEISAKNIEIDELHQKINYYDEQLQVNITSYIFHYLIY